MKKVEFTGGDKIKLVLPDGQSRKVVPGMKLDVPDEYAENLTISGNFRLVTTKPKVTISPISKKKKSKRR